MATKKETKEENTFTNIIDITNYVLEFYIECNKNENFSYDIEDFNFYCIDKAINDLELNQPFFENAYMHDTIIVERIA